MLKRKKEFQENMGNELMKYNSSAVAGQVVIARFTNGGQANQFRGEVVGVTKNYFKVKALEDFRLDRMSKPPKMYEETGRVFHVATFVSRIYSINNCIMPPEWFEEV